MCIFCSIYDVKMQFHILTAKVAAGIPMRKGIGALKNKIKYILVQIMTKCNSLTSINLFETYHFIKM